MGAWKSCVHAYVFEPVQTCPSCPLAVLSAQDIFWLFMSMTLAKGGGGGLSGMQAVTHYEYELLWCDDPTELEQSLRTGFCTLIIINCMFVCLLLSMYHTEILTSHHIIWTDYMYLMLYWDVWGYTLWHLWFSASDIQAAAALGEHAGPLVPAIIQLSCLAPSATPQQSF